MKFSIIVPVYNTRSIFLQEAITSILKQVYTNFELIIVDDGSNVETKKSLENICQQDNRITLNTTDNFGVSAARNLGTQKATGDYIIYVDSDDILSPYFLENANKILKNNNLDLLLSQITFDKQLLNEKKFEYYTNSNIIMDLKKYYLSFFNSNFKDKRKWVNRGPVARVIKKSIALQNLFDPSIDFGEDVLWNLELLEKVRNVGLLKMPCYFYRKNNESVTSTYHSNFSPKLEKLMVKIHQKINPAENLLTKEFAVAAFEYYRIFLKLDLCHKKNDIDTYQKYKILKQQSDRLLRNTALSKISYQGFTLKQKIFLFLVKHRLYKIILWIQNK